MKQLPLVYPSSTNSPAGWVAPWALLINNVHSGSCSGQITAVFVPGSLSFPRKQVMMGSLPPLSGRKRKMDVEGSALLWRLTDNSRCLSIICYPEQWGADWWLHWRISPGGLYPFKPFFLLSVWHTSWQNTVQRAVWTAWHTASKLLLLLVHWCWQCTLWLVDFHRSLWFVAVTSTHIGSSCIWEGEMTACWLFWSINHFIHSDRKWLGMLLLFLLSLLARPFLLPKFCQWLSLNQIFCAFTLSFLWFGAITSNL